jgi:hypothetical protein
MPWLGNKAFKKWIVVVIARQKYDGKVRDEELACVQAC